MNKGYGPTSSESAFLEYSTTVVNSMIVYLIPIVTHKNIHMNICSFKIALETTDIHVNVFVGNNWN